MPLRRGSVLSLFNLREFEVNQDFIARRWLVKEVGGREESDLLDIQSWVSSA